VMESDASLQLLRAAHADDSETPCCATREPTGCAQADEGRAEGRAERVGPELTDGRRIASGCDARAQAAADGVGTQDARTVEEDRHRTAGSSGDRGRIDGDPGALPEATPSDSSGESSNIPTLGWRDQRFLAWRMGRAAEAARHLEPLAGLRPCVLAIACGAYIRCGFHAERRAQGHVSRGVATKTVVAGKGTDCNCRKTPRLRTRITSKVKSLEEPPPWGLLACGFLLAIIARVLIVVLHDSKAEWDLQLAGRDLAAAVEGAIH
jgi:hypothetical protein